MSQPEKAPPLKAWRPTIQDARLLAEIKAKLGVLSESDIVRMGLRKLAQAEGILPK